MIRGIPQRWRVLSGQNNWHNMLNPLDGDLQQYLIHYGAMAQATYDTFNSERLSNYTGSSRYSKRNLFSRVGLVKGNLFKYEAVKYIYATSSIVVPEAFILEASSGKSWCGESNWIGYVAVATDEGKVALGRRDILVAWRGSVQPIEWLKDMDFPLVPASEIVGKTCNHANVHKGFLSIYTSENHQSTLNKTSARDQVLSEVKRQVEKFKDEEMSITVTGHSLGAALSTLNAADIVCNGYNKIDDHPNKACPVSVFSFASPRVGDSNFKDTLLSKNDLRILSIRNVPDMIPHAPPTIGYTDVGVELQVDSRKSPFLKNSRDMASWHNLEAAYLHAIAMARGNKVERDIALVNKSSRALKNKYMIPTFWWREKNKGMVQTDNGTWKLDDRENDDVDS